MNSILLQIAAAAPTEAQPMSMLSLLMKGGVVMIPIVILSIASIYIFVERLIHIRQRAKSLPNFTSQIIDQLEEGNIKGANALCERNTGAMGNIIQSGLICIGKPIREIETMMESQTNIELAEMEKNLSYLGLIAGIAPMLGFIGTISGVIKIFYNISLTDNISIGIIAGGLYEKMISSGSGLVVGLLAYSAYHLLNHIIDRFSLDVQKQTLSFLQRIQKSSK
ncbi:MAG: MotA/TolQ/ExbB proton channel family protein [Bacteroidota bacterium]